MAYERLSERLFSLAWGYFFTLLLLTLLIMSGLLFPYIVAIKGQIDDQMSAFDTLTVDVDQEMNGPFQLHSGIYIDTRSEIDPKGSILTISESTLYCTSPLCSVFFTDEMPLSTFEDLKNNSDYIAHILFVLVVLLLPSFFMLAYVYYAIKALMIGLVLSVLMFALSKIIKLNIDLYTIYKIALYASIFLMMYFVLELFMFTYYIPLLVYAVYLLLGTIYSGSFDTVHSKRS